MRSSASVSLSLDGHGNSDVEARMANGRGEKYSGDVILISRRVLHRSSCFFQATITLPQVLNRFHESFVTGGPIASDRSGHSPS
jgi:hypothetical protein